MATVQYVSAREEYRDSIRRLLRLIDDEFVPPLTSDRRATISRAEQECGKTDIEGYVERCVSRPMVGAIEEDELVGFISFTQLDKTPQIETHTPSNHAEIVGVDPKRRGEGLGNRLYEYLLFELPSSHRLPFVSTKTWDTNKYHIAILESLEFKLVNCISDDRGPNVNTVYYARSV